MSIKGKPKSEEHKKKLAISRTKLCLYDKEGNKEIYPFIPTICECEGRNGCSSIVLTRGSIYAHGHWVKKFKPNKNKPMQEIQKNKISNKIKMWYLENEHPKRKLLSSEELKIKQKRKERLKKKKEKENKKIKYPCIPDICHCNKCNEIVYSGHKYIFGHHNINKSSPMKGQIPWNKNFKNWFKFIGIEHPLQGTHRSDKTKNKISKSNKGKKRHSEEQKQKWSKERSKEGNANWHGGTSSYPYSFDFDNKLKEEIRIRDNYQCQNPNCLCTQLESLKLYKKILHIHHIHYDKENPNPDLITLCPKCNSKANFNRNYWTQLYMNILNERELLFWTLRRNNNEYK